MTFVFEYMLYTVLVKQVFNVCMFVHYYELWNVGFGTDNDAVDTFWINLFTIHFNCSNESPEDDMLFFVKKMQPGNNADMNLKVPLHV